ncbi:hypothetical protein [Mesorhizobium sp.]|uniref:hypothetical protein n=1 Tax=Mesorhizobium sp. TaxID=1871066 RepID=UPI000FEA46AA|nr:hypothetical protein [Mesorhizobium sp.]RWB69897.1 MAG: hypothetical protein EOQ49_18715 [Mesorhizobium sp.]
MCKQVRSGAKIYSTPRQLAGFLDGSRGIEWLDCQGEMDWCLCVVDVPRSLERASIKWTWESKTQTYLVER